MLHKKVKSYKKAALFAINFLNIVFVTFFFGAAWLTVYAQSISIPFSGKGNYVIIAIFCVLFMAFAKLYKGFEIGKLRVAEVIYSGAIALAVSNMLMYAIIVLLTRRLVNPAGIIWSILCQMLWHAIWAVYSNRIYIKMFPPKVSAILYGNIASRNSMQQINPHRFDVRHEFEITENTQEKEMFEMLENAECIFLCGVNSQARNEIVKYCVSVGKEVFIRPHISDIILSGAKRLQMCNVPVLQCTKSEPSPWYLFVKRAFDISVSLVGLIVASPVLLITAAAVKFSDGGPALFTQLRMTKDRKVFKIYKFRSMRVDADKGGKGIVTMQNDDRITPIGKFIRMCRIDEIPQLINILKGDMTIVGPRPERLETIEIYEQETPEFALRLQITAGLTGYAQIHGKANTSAYDKLQMDLMYIANMGIIEDLKIIFATIKILFMPESTEGFESAKDLEQDQIKAGNKY